MIATVAETIREWLPIAWSLVALVVLAVLFGSGALDGLAGRVKKVSGFGVDLEFSEGSVRQFKGTVESALQGAKAELDSVVAAEARALDLRNRLRAALGPLLSPASDLRATVHVEDPLLANWLYQAVDYVPFGGGKARRFDAASGIIGLAWRLGRDQYAYRSAGTTNEDYAAQWGLTLEQAQLRGKVDKGKVMCARVIRFEGRIVGLLYADRSVDVEPTDRAGQQAIEQQFTADTDVIDFDKLAKALDDLLKKVRTAGPQLALDQLTNP